jgi:3-oxoadipate enol-lactonase
MPTIRANGVETFYQFDGASRAPTLMLSNSLGAHLGMWDAQVPAFSDRFRVLRYDSRGHGRSSVPPGPYSIDDFGRDALALIDGLGLDRVSFCGLSKGGMVGMWLASNAPARLESLVLSNTSARIGAPEIWNSRIEKVRTSGMDAIADGVLERWFTSDFRARAPEAVATARRMLVATPAAGYVASCAALRDMDQRKTLASIRVRTLVIAGSLDLATPPSHGQAIAAAIPGARVVELAAAHLSNIEVPTEFNAAVLELLAA